MLYFSIQNARAGREKYPSCMVGSFSDRSHIATDVSPVFSKFLSLFGRSFFVAGAVFGEVLP